MIEEATGYAFDARWKPAPGFALGAGASRAELAGRALMRWEDTEVAADGNWRDDAAHASLVLGSNDRVGLAATAAWLERGSLGFGPVDGLAPHLWWRTGEVALSGRALLPRIDQRLFENLALFFTAIAALKLLWS